MPDVLTSFSVEVENFAVVTHRVPADRVRAHLPDIYELQTFEQDGEEYAFVSATCFCNRDFRVTGVPFPRHTFNESTYRTYVDYNGRWGVYFIGRYLGTPLAVSAQKTLARDTWRGDFDVSIDRTADGYRSYVCNVSGDHGGASFSVEAADPPSAQAPFSSVDEHTQFITYRLSGLFTSTAGLQGHMPVSHPRMRPYQGRLFAGRFEFWERLGIVRPEEREDVYSVLVLPHVPFTLHPPRPALGA